MARRKAFTLVELLVVIAIISVLMALLLPVLKGARARAMVLVCPIAYVGRDGSVHLTDPEGKYDLAVPDPAPGQRAAGSYSVSWSPSGQHLLCQTYWPMNLNVVDPATGRPTLRVQDNFIAMDWLDGERIVIAKSVGMFVLNANTGQFLNKDPIPPRGRFPGDIGLLPSHCAPMAFVAPWHTPGTNYDRLAFFRKDLSVSASIPGTDNARGSRVDPLGEWLAWVDPTQRPNRLGLRRLKDPPFIASTFFTTEFQFLFVCDWSEDGNLLLVNGTADYQTWTLALYDKTGKLVRKIPTAVPPQGTSIASWRRYGHR